RSHNRRARSASIDTGPSLVSSRTTRKSLRRPWSFEICMCRPVSPVAPRSTTVSGGGVPEREQLVENRDGVVVGRRRFEPGDAGVAAEPALLAAGEASGALHGQVERLVEGGAAEDV